MRGDSANITTSINIRRPSGRRAYPTVANMPRICRTTVICIHLGRGSACCKPKWRDCAVLGPRSNVPAHANPPCTDNTFCCDSDTAVFLRARDGQRGRRYSRNKEAGLERSLRLFLVGFEGQHIAHFLFRKQVAGEKARVVHCCFKFGPLAVYRKGVDGQDS